MKDHKDKFQYQEYKIIEKEELAPQTFLFKFEGKIKFIPGQFIQAAIDRYGEATFAICSDPDNKKTFELCIRGAGGATNKMIELSPGDKLKIRGPYGNGWPISKLLGQNIILLAGGMGIVPIRPLLYQLSKYKSEFKKINLLAGFRSDHLVLFEEELRNLNSKISLRVVAEHCSKDFWGEHGLITEPLSKMSMSPNKTKVLICGPEIMVGFCNKVLLDKKIKEQDIYISFERRMECGIGICQHCNIGKYLVCKDGPIFSLDKIKDEIGK